MLMLSSHVSSSRRLRSTLDLQVFGARSAGDVELLTLLSKKQIKAMEKTLRGRVPSTSTCKSRTPRGVRTFRRLYGYQL